MPRKHKAKVAKVRAWRGCTFAAAGRTTVPRLRAALNVAIVEFTRCGCDGCKDLLTEIEAVLEGRAGVTQARKALGIKEGK